MNKSPTGPLARIDRLVVFEGPENTGKTTLAEGLVAALNARGISADYMSFPGRNTASIGAVVYDVDHHPAKFGLTSIPSSSRQALHLAAHLDAIDSRIKPTLAAGRWVILDRSWWSMWAHGIAQGLPSELLRHLLAAETEAWSPIKPAVIFSTLRPAPYKETMTPEWQAVAAEYRKLEIDQLRNQSIITLNPDAPLADRLKSCMEWMDERGLSSTIR